jgi:hypothetical protein
VTAVEVAGQRGGREQRGRGRRAPQCCGGARGRGGGTGQWPEEAGIGEVLSGAGVEGNR